MWSDLRKLNYSETSAAGVSMAHLTTTETSPEQELSKLLGVASVCAVHTNGATELPDGTLALQLNKSSSYCYGVRSEDLCKLLGVNKHRTIRVRTTGEEGRGKKFSLIDMAMIVSGKDSSNALPRPSCAEPGKAIPSRQVVRS